MEKRNVLNSPRLLELKKQRRKVFMRKIWFFVFAFIALLVALAFFSRVKGLQITEIQFTGNKVADTDALKALAQKELEGKYLWLFPKTNILYYPKESITLELQNNFKGLGEIDLKIEGNKILMISVDERAGVYTWCGAVIPVLNSNNEQKCYFVDEGGYIFAEAPYFSEGVYFKFYGGVDINAESPIGSYFLKNTFAKIISFKNTLESFNLEPSAFWLDSFGDARFSLRSKSAIDPEIIFKIDADLEKVAENLKTALETEPLKSKFKNKFNTLEYIDLRFGNKVFNKFNE